MRLRYGWLLVVGTLGCLTGWGCEEGTLSRDDEDVVPPRYGPLPELTFTRGSIDAEALLPRSPHATRRLTGEPIDADLPLSTHAIHARDLDAGADAAPPPDATSDPAPGVDAGN